MHALPLATIPAAVGAGLAGFLWLFAFVPRKRVNDDAYTCGAALRALVPGALWNRRDHRAVVIQALVGWPALVVIALVPHLTSDEYWSFDTAHGAWHTGAWTAYILTAGFNFRVLHWPTGRELLRRRFFAAGPAGASPHAAAVVAVRAGIARPGGDPPTHDDAAGAPGPPAP